jgi:hypothetical protein
MRSASKAVLFAVVAVAAAGGVAAIGCMGEGAAFTPGPDDAEAGPGPLAWLRLANLSPTAPNIDFCVAPFSLDAGPEASTGAFVGPLLSQLASRLAAAGSPVTPLTGGFGIPFNQASAYVAVAPFQPYIVRIVAGNAGSCAAPIVTDLPGLPVPGPDASVVDGGALAANEFLTIALMGEQFPPQSSYQGVALVDDPDVDGGTSTSKAYLRFVNAAVGQPQVDVLQGLASSIGQGTTRLFGNVAYGQVPNTPDAAVDAAAYDEGGPGVTVDRNGYWATSGIAANANNTFMVYPSGGLDGSALAQAKQLFVAAGGIVTVALTGDVVANDAGRGVQAYQLLVCVDNGATTGLFATCTIPPPL